MATKRKKAFMASLRTSFSPNVDADEKSETNSVEQPSSFVDFVTLHTSNQDNFDLHEFFQSLQRKEIVEIWKSMHARVLEVLESGQYASDEETVEQMQALEYLESVTTLITEFISDKSRKATDELAQLMQQLHDIIFTVESEQGYFLQTSITRVCEAWWVQGRPQKEFLVPQTLPFILIRSLEDTSKRGDVIRVFNMREGLKLLDLADESSDTLKHLLLRCVLHPLFLRTSEGRRFISFLFSLDIPFIDHIHMAIKNQIPFCRASLLNHYGEVYFRAWRLAEEGQMKLKIESSCIQDLMHCAIHVANQRTAKSVQRILHHFHDNKRVVGVDSMLHRLYAPIIWRAMKVANCLVRKNASTLFIDAFPIQDPSDSREATDKMLQKQLDQLLALLTDTNVGVRTVGIQGVCRVLSIYWELLPVAMAKAMVLKLISDLAFDASVANVRVAVFEGLAFVLDNHLSHGLMKIVLPQLAPLIHDKSEKVQLAFLNLLLVVKRIRSLRFYEIVDVDNLLLRLQFASSNKVTSKITELLINSFFPYNKSEGSQLRRACVLINKSPEAAKVFFGQVYEHAAPESICKLAANLYHTVVGSAKMLSEDAAKEDKADHANDAMMDVDDDDVDVDDENEGGSKKRNRTTRKGTGSDHMTSIDASNAAVVESVLCVIAKLWFTVEMTTEDTPSEFNELWTLMGNEFNDGGLELLMPPSLSSTSLVSTAADASKTLALSPLACIAVINIASRLPSKCAPGLTNNSVMQLAQLPHTSTAAEYGPMLECLFSWGQHEQIMTLIMKAVKKGLEGELSVSTPPAQPTKPKGSRGKGKAQRGAGKKSAGKKGGDDVEFEPLMALTFYSYLLQNERTRSVLLMEDKEENNGKKKGRGRKKKTAAAVSISLRQLMSQSFGKLEELLAFDDRTDLSHANKENDFLLMSFSLHCQLQLHMHAHATSEEAVAREELEQMEQMERSVADAQDEEDERAKQALTDLITALSAKSTALSVDVRHFMEFVSAIVVPELDLSKKAKAATRFKVAADPAQSKNKRARKAKKAASTEKKMSPENTKALHARRRVHLKESMILMLSRFSVELVTLGCEGEHAPLPQMCQFVDSLTEKVDAAAQANFRAKKGGDEKTNAAVAGDLDTDAVLNGSSLVLELLPVLYKLIYQLSTQLHLSPSPSNDKTFASLSSPAKRQIFDKLFRGVLRLTPSDLSMSAADIDSLYEQSSKASAATKCALYSKVRAAITEVLRSASKRRSSLRHILSILSQEVTRSFANEFDASMDDEDEELAEEDILIQSADQLSPLQLVLLTAVARSPASVFVLPHVMHRAVLPTKPSASLTTSSAPELESSPTSSTLKVNSTVRLLSALSVLCEAHVSQPSKQSKANDVITASLARVTALHQNETGQTDNDNDNDMVLDKENNSSNNNNSNSNSNSDGLATEAEEGDIEKEDKSATHTASVSVMNKLHSILADKSDDLQRQISAAQTQKSTGQA